MEKQSFKDTLITDTKFYDPNTSCGKYIKRKGFNLDDLLGPNYEKIHKKSRSHTRRQLETLVTMLRHIYLGESLPKINIEYSTKTISRTITILKLIKILFSFIINVNPLM